MSVIPTRDRPPQVMRTAPGVVRKGPGMPAATGLTGRDILRILRKRKWLIILLVGIFTAISIISTALWLQYSPFYTAEALISVRQPMGETLRGGANRPISTDIVNQMTRTQAQLIKGEPTLADVARRDDVRGTAWYSRIGPQNVLQELVDEIQVAPIRDTNLIRVYMSGVARNPTERSELALIINAVCIEAIRSVVSVAKQGRQSHIEELQTESRNLATQLARIRRDIAAALPTDSPKISEFRTVLSIKFQALENQVTRLELDLAQAKAMLQSLREQSRRGTLSSQPQVMMIVDNDQILRSLRIAEVNLETQRKSLLRKFMPKHQTVMDLETRLASVRNQIVEREKTVTKDAITSLVEMRQNEVDSLTAQLAEVRDRLANTNASLKRVQETLARVDQLRAQEDALVSQIDRIDQRETELRIAVRREEPILLARSATEPREPSMPKWSIMVPVGVMLGLLIGLSLAFLLEFIDTSIKGPADLTKRMDLPLLGVVPHTDDLEETIDDIRLAFATNPNSLIGEAFRQIRTCLMFSGPAEQRRSLLITSPSPEDGRGTVTMNLAAAMSSGGRNVLVVDANFRQPTVRELYPDCPEGGLSSALTGQADWRDLVRQVEPNLSVMTAGPLPPNPAELLGSEQMQTLVSEMVAQYDQVVFNGAPCLVVSDAAVLSTMIDAVILVVRAGVNTSGIVQRTRIMLDRVGARILGVVLNGMRATAGGYLRKNYDTFYEYHEQRKLPVKDKA